MNAVDILQNVQGDSRYLENLDWGRPRAGHPEGTIRAHIADLERNLQTLTPRLAPEEVGRLRLLVHVHDTFKKDAVSGVSIRDPRSHASLARQFLAEFCDDEDLLAMVQWHDEPFALYRQFLHRGQHSESRLNALLAAINDWDLFVAFLIIDGCTPGKERGPLQWLLTVLSRRIATRWTLADLL